MHKLANLAENSLRLAILTGFSFFFYHVVSGGGLLQLIHPQFTLNAKLGLGLFLLLTAAQAIRLAGCLRPASCGCHHHHFGGFFYYSFIGVLAVFLLIPLKPLGAATAGQKGIKYLVGQAVATAGQPNAPTAVASGSRPLPPLRIDDSNHVRLITAIYEDTEKFLDREIELAGFVYRPDQLAPQQFMLARFEISCCAADGVPSGLIVDWPQSLDYANDDWLHVRGRLRQGEYQGIPIPVLTALSVARIAPLPNPYVYTGEPVFLQDHRDAAPQP
ncbi:MAG: TIGR03943 family protein [Sporomusaceae bacterium]|nr:TIGR03943 family protein [Sporomusaceae bacterium]